ncbi:acetyl-CoA-benzylalcohol acetyltransferase-like [Rhodamnia argentea]|uniref:Acetyl-CoA-benzylalcohol acetyltransferase-like n=1 Tax=Rhodamnia argentea TaxID=178133 RepID=A0A8B8NSJ3_9MYRT|nr:acetyl-CoA-benzylalcohol acetyltransferase-like [Rhodamnia argentea]
MKVEVQWKKLVKPSVPTPSNRRKWKLSSMDELQMPNYVGVIFYYRDDAENPGVDISKRLQKMEESLSKTLTIFYPMAGRYIEEDGCFIDCNDLGVEFVHAKVDGQIDQLLHGDPDMDLLDILSQFPTNLVGNPLVVIQVNTFDCGGLAIALRSTHKISDVYTMAMFVNSWATACRGNIDMTICPSFELSSLFPAKASTVPNWPPPRTIGDKELVMSRFRFSGNAISKLKALARDDAKDSTPNNSQPSRVAVVSALISRALASIDQYKHGEQRSFVIYMTFNLREKINLAIPANSCGNLFAMIFGRSCEPIASKSKLEFKEMVNITSKMISDARKKYAAVVDREEFCSMVCNSIAEFVENVSSGEECPIAFSSWCRFGLYEIDFGWGRPVLVHNISLNLKSIFLMDHEESGGIDAWITTSEDEMILLKQDPDILAFTS